MISVFELVQAGRNHLAEMEDMPSIAGGLDIDLDELMKLIGSFIQARTPEEHAKSKDSAYLGGFEDGFFMGVKAQLAEYFVLCEQCGKAVWRGDEDPVPEDYDPEKHRMMCSECILARQASMN